VPITDPNPRNEGSRRRTALIWLAVGTVLLLLIVGSQQAFNLKFLRPEGSVGTLTFAALSALIFLLLVTLSFILARNLLKLYAERRVGVVGSKFRTRTVMGALLLSFAPTLFLSYFSYGLMNRSIDKWFSTPIQEVARDTKDVTTLVTDYATDNARLEAQAIAVSPETQHSFDSGNFSGVMNEFRRHQTTIQGGFALALTRDTGVPGAPSSGTAWNADASFLAPQAWTLLRKQLPPDFAERGALGPQPMNDKMYAVGVAKAGENGRILVAMPLPERFTKTIERITASQKNYEELAKQRKLVQRTYLAGLLLLTVLALFAATWIALFLSKLVTRPVAALADAMGQISQGRLDARVQVAAADELGDLVASFNDMAGELESNRRQIDASNRSLAQANEQIEQRRKQIETILESIPTGVLSLDAARKVTHANHAFSRMFHSDAPEGQSISELFPEEVATDILHLLRKADRMGATTSQMEVTVPHSKIDVAVTAASLKHDRQRLGYVVVFEDLSDVLRAEKQAAWREVARRVAHEIKNPLTPIALSAQRIQRHLDRGGVPDDQSLAVMRGCAETIAGAVETVRTLVDEFSTLARFPNAQPQPAHINSIVEGALAMFNGRLDGIGVQTFLSPDLPRVMADPEAIKRVVANLVDNAAEAMQDSMLREVQISTSLLSGRDAIEIVVADTGHGVSPEVKQKLFLPYFSTKKRGTGLGLAIVSRIVEEHRGHIRVEENKPVGARFIVELPVAAESAGTTGASTGTHG
jgi:two-component system, NtrC family, nitrogen regulation sensor histidine kinase NtrY